MTYHTNVIAPLMLSTLIVGCTSNPAAPALSEAQLETQRAYTAKLQQKDRDRDHVERKRRGKDGVYYYPYYRRSSELSNISIR